MTLALAVTLAWMSVLPNVPRADAAGSLSADDAFLTAAYTDFLGRAPTSAEFAAVADTAMASPTARAAVVSRLSKSTEWIRVTVDRLYTDTLGRPGDAGGIAHWVAQLSSGRWSVAGAAAWFYSSPEYFAGFGESDKRTWVRDLYTKILLRDASKDPAGVDYWVSQTAAKGRTAVALDFYQSNESRHTRVATLYRVLLGRAPEQGGWDYWAGQVGSKGDLALAANLAASPEYFERAANRYGTGIPPVPSSVSVTKTWETVLGAGRVVAGSSPTVATIDGAAPVVIVGDRGGHVNALRIDSGAKAWEASTSGAPVEAPASVVGAGAGVRIFVGVGGSSKPGSGGYLALDKSGGRVWYVQPKATPSGGTTGVSSGMTVGNFQGTNDVASGSMGQLAYAMSSGGQVLSGFPWFEGDSNFATPATLDVDGNGRDEIVMGGDSTAGLALGHRYTNGGFIRILSGRGGSGSGTPPKGLVCRYDTNQVVQSSPAVGRFLSGGAVGIVAGTGTYWSGASDTNKVIAVDKACKLRWKADLGANTSSSVALADVIGDGGLAVVAGTRSSANAGSVVALDGATGRRLWTTNLSGGVYGGIATADLRRIGRQDVVVGTAGGVFILDGRTGAIIGRVGSGIAVQNTVLITKDPNGRAGITVAGYNGRNEGVVAHYQVDGSQRPVVGGVGGWPMFHHDRALSGNSDHPS